eukprot:TRINITY_DN217_c0_g2_i1.p1 TRINITY_DN217_c0_g2~~TRINITY_DN217_c0_g2_i1.p1  ORF type:complete len:431 (+),score=79.28 TRINITY_DN217_c0_g2_i1:172-1293(+)
MHSTPVIACSSRHKWECFQTSLLFTLSLIALFFLIILWVRVYKWLRKSSFRTWTLVLLTFAAIECICLIVRNGFMNRVEWQFAAVYFESLQFSVLAFLFIRHVCSFHRNMEWIREALVPGLLTTITALTIVSTVVLVLSALNVMDPSDCRDLVWVVLSTTGFVIGCVFLSSGIAVSKWLTRIYMPYTLRSRKLRHLWFLLIVYFASAVVGLMNDLYMLIAAKKKSDCEKFSDSVVVNHIIVTLERCIHLIFPVYALIAFEWTALRSKGGSGGQQYEPEESNSPATGSEKQGKPVAYGTMDPAARPASIQVPQRDGAGPSGVFGYARYARLSQVEEEDEFGMTRPFDYAESAVSNLTPPEDAEQGKLLGRSHHN